MNYTDVYKIESFFDKRGWEAAAVWKFGHKFRVYSEYANDFLSEVFDEISSAEKVCENLTEI